MLIVVNGSCDISFQAQQDALGRKRNISVSGIVGTKLNLEVLHVPLGKDEHVLIGGFHQFIDEDDVGEHKFEGNVQQTSVLVFHIHSKCILTET